MAFTGADRARAVRLRTKVKAGVVIEPTEAAWLSDYEEAMTEKRESRGASAARSVKYEETESASVGVGESAAAVAAAAAMVREEGRREDSLEKLKQDGLTRAFDMCMRMCEGMMKRTEALERVHVTLLTSWRDNFLSRTELEAEQIVTEAERQAEAVAKEEGGDSMSKLADTLLPMLMAKMMGVPVTPNGAPGK
jgi:hypothetical protein